MNSIIFFGVPQVASEILESLIGTVFEPALVVTSPDKPVGRKQVMTASPVKELALQNGIQVITPETLRKNDALYNDLSVRDPSLFIIVAYGQLFPKRYLSIAKYGAINIHYSLLPKYRGASPVESALLSGETETGVTIQKLALKMDSGDILSQTKISISPAETAPELFVRLNTQARSDLHALLPDIFDNKTNPTAQIEAEATYCSKFTKEDGLLDIVHGKPSENYNRYRAFVSRPRTYFINDEDKRVIINEAHLEDGCFVITKITPEGKKEIHTVIKNCPTGN